MSNELQRNNVIIITLTEASQKLEKKIDKMFEGERDKHILKKLDQANERDLKLEKTTVTKSRQCYNWTSYAGDASY